MVKVYQGIPDKYIESYLWVKKCVEKGAVVYTPLVYKNPGGRRPGEEYERFSHSSHASTEVQETEGPNLPNKTKHTSVLGSPQRFLIRKPVAELGIGFTNSFAISFVLINLHAFLLMTTTLQAPDPEYAWVSRHTWQSWRERYKKNAARLDAMIAAIVEQKKPAQGEKGQYGYVRKAEEKPKKSRKKRARNVEPANTDEEYVAALDDTNEALPTMIDMLGIQSMRDIPEMSGITAMYSTVDHMHTPSSGPLDRPPISNVPAEEEMDDADEGTEWQIRIGNDALPQWGKRKADEKEEESLKRQRTM